MPSSLYDLLEVSRTAPPEVVRAAYRALAAKHHPDRSGDSGGAEFTKITRAYETLIDPARRAEYDARILHGEEGIFLEQAGENESKAPRTVKRTDGTDTWCTIEEHVRRKGMELSRADLRDVCIKHVSLAGARLVRADLSSAVIEKVSLDGANLSGVVCRNATFRNVSFRTANLGKANFEACLFEKCNFDGLMLSDATFTASDFRGSSFVDSWLKNVDLSNSILRLVVFARSSRLVPQGRSFGLSRCRLDGCDLTGAVFGYHALSASGRKAEAAYYPVSCSNTGFFGANLSEAIFASSRLSNCDLCEATLTKAVLRQAIVENCVFNDASLMAADFSSARLSQLDFSTCNVVDTRFHNTVRHDVEFPDGFDPPAPAPVSSPPTDPRATRKEASPLLLIPAVVFVVVWILFLSSLGGF